MPADKMSIREREFSRGEFIKLSAAFLGGIAIGWPLIAKSRAEAKDYSKVAKKPFPEEAQPTPQLQEITPTPQPQETATPPPQEIAPQLFEQGKIEAKTGTELLEKLGLRGKIVYVVYGRPQKYEGQETWGSLEASRTAEESWQVFQERKETISQAIGKNSQDFTLNVLNPVYGSQNGVIKDIYTQKALELAPENQGVVALNFNSTSEAYETLQRLESISSKELLQYLAVSLDVEHFPNRCEEAKVLNEFSFWFAQKHQEWAGDSASIPGLVLIYTMHGSNKLGRILNPGELVQYYLSEKTLVVPIFDGFGTKQAKFDKMADLVRLLPNTSEFPALLGVMEFRSKWGDQYDKASIEEIFGALQGAPTFFFASQ